MSFDGITRSVRTNRHDRNAGDAPTLGRMARMPGTGLPKGSRRKRRKDESSRGGRIRKARNRMINTWSILLSGVVLVILGGAVWLWIGPQTDSSGEFTGRPPAGTAESARVASKFPSPSEAKALDVVKRGLVIRDPGMIGEYFRMGTASPQQIVDFLRGLEAKDGAINRYDWLSSMDANGLSIDGVVVHFKGADKARNRVVLLTPDEAGKWQIDFDAFARTVKPSWTELLAAQADVALVRVYAVKDNYYNGLFINEKEWICYALASPDTDQILMAYCKSGSAQAAAMDWIFLADTKMTRMTLEIRRVAGAESRQFEITKVIAVDWVVSAVPFDKGFE